MFNNRTVICGGIAVFECLVYIGLGISIAFFHKENPSIGIQISTVVRLCLDGLVAHRLSLMQVNALLAQIVGIVVQRHHVVIFPLQTGIVSRKGFLLFTFLMKDISGYGIEVRNQVGRRLCIHLRQSETELTERLVFLIFLIIRHSTEVIEHHFFGIILLSRLTLLGNQVIFLLVPEHLYELHSGIHVIRSYGKHLFEGTANRVGRHLLQTHISSFHLCHIG